MPTNSAANVVFLPWIRQGAAAAIPTLDNLGELPGSATLTAALTVNTTEPPISMPVRLQGPSDVVGIGSRDIVRREPPPNSASFEPNHFVTLEFDRPDFPWLFTPAKADANARLRPWLCLIVVRKQDGVAIRPGTPDSLPAIELASTDDELPDLTESWLWAHGQIAASDKSGSDNADSDMLRGTLAGDPNLSLSRLICPRLLAADTEYIACLVPTFEAGIKAGLGLPVDSNEALKPAWLSGPNAPTSITLPLYDSWTFRTGPGGDFKSLAMLLRARPAPESLGKRPVDISQPGFQLPATFPAGATVNVEGALKPLKASDTVDWPSGTQDPFQAALAAIVNTGTMTSSGDPVLAPPLYGRWHAGKETAKRTPPGLTWFDELNLDPRHRAVSAFGTRVVQEHQEALMASAWQQAGDLQSVNQRMRQLQVSLSVGESLHARYVQRMDIDATLRVAAPAFTRMRLPNAPVSGAPTFATHFSNAAVPLRAMAPAMRKLTRTTGPVNRRLLSVASNSTGMKRFLSRINVDVLVVEQPTPAMVTFNTLRGQTGLDSIRAYAQVTRDAVAGMPGEPQFQMESEGTRIPMPVRGVTIPLVDNAVAAAFRAAASAHLEKLNPARPWITIFRPPIVLDLEDDMLTQLHLQMRPRRMIMALATALVPTGGNTSTDDSTPVSTVMHAPKFPQPMYEALRDLSQDLLLPGLNDVKADTAIGLRTNRSFVEAYMVGLNFEMGRELLWRGYPTDQRGTYFDQFWDRSSTNSQHLDIDPIHRWGDRALGGGSSADDQFVMLLRTELLRRYPTASIYAAPAVRTNGKLTPNNDERVEIHPAFRGALPPDVTFVGFDLKVRDAVGGSGAGDGYFIIIQEQATEPHFGMDVGIAPTGTTYLRASADAPNGLPLRGLPWGQNPAHMAGILRRVPVRIAIHASQFIAREDLQDLP
jgi:hypothetical protein